MKRNFFKLSMLLAAAAVCFSCGEPEPTVEGVRFTSGINETRASGTSWSNGDEIGVFMTQNGTELSSNVNYYNTRSGSAADFTSETPIFFPNVGNVDFLAYYPYREGQEMGNYRVNVSSQSSSSRIDLMTASVADQAKTTDAVNLQFTHRLSHVSLSITAGEGLQTADLTNMEVDLLGTKAHANYDITTDVIDFAGADEVPIRMNTASSGTSTSAIVIPQALSGAQFAFHTVAFGSFEALIENVNFEPGHSYNFEVTLNVDENYGKVAANLTGITINPWVGDEDITNDTITSGHMETSVKVGDYYFADGTTSSSVDGKTPIAIVYQVNADNTGRAVGLDETTAQWSREYVYTNANDMYHGQENMAIIMALDSAEQKYPAFAWVDAKNPANSVYEGGKQAQWYLPAAYELKALYEAKDIVNAKLATVSGATLLYNTGDAGTEYYWSSSEYNYDYSIAYFVHFSSGGLYRLNLRKDNSFRVRSVLAF